MRGGRRGRWAEAVFEVCRAGQCAQRIRPSRRGALVFASAIVPPPHGTHPERVEAHPLHQPERRPARRAVDQRIHRAQSVRQPPLVARPAAGRAPMHQEPADRTAHHFHPVLDRKLHVAHEPVRPHGGCVPNRRQSPRAEHPSAGVRGPMATTPRSEARDQEPDQLVAGKQRNAPLRECYGIRRPCVTDLNQKPPSTCVCSRANR